MKKLKITIEGISYEVDVEILHDDDQPVSSRRSTPTTRPAPESSAATPSSSPAAATLPAAAASTSSSADDLLCPLSGVVVTINAPVGKTVAEGETVITLEAMKMYTTVCAHKAGTIKAVHVGAGQSVEENQPLVTIV